MAKETSVNLIAQQNELISKLQTHIALLKQWTTDGLGRPEPMKAASRHGSSHGDFRVLPVLSGIPKGP